MKLMTPIPNAMMTRGSLVYAMRQYEECGEHDRQRDEHAHVAGYYVTQSARHRQKSCPVNRDARPCARGKRQA